MSTLPVRRGTGTATGTGTDRWNPLQELDELHERMSRLLQSSVGEAGIPALSRWAPPVDLEETEDEFVVEAELPGVKRDDVTVEVLGNELAIHGEIKERERTGILRRTTRRTGQFDYRVTLPGEVDADAVEASLTEGVLRVVARKSEQARPRRIEITAA